MSRKNKPDDRGIVYSTDPGFKFEGEQEQNESLSPSLQKLIVKLETKHRAGKIVTLVEGFCGPEEKLQELGKKLKSYCGAGGTAKDACIIIQGDHREKLMQWLGKNGYTNARKR